MQTKTAFQRMSKHPKKINIAIDGYSSCGKSTLAKAMSASLNYIFIDSGAMYRGVTLYAMENGLLKDDMIDAEGLKRALTDIELVFGELAQSGKDHPLLLNGKDVSKEIRTMEVSRLVSKVAAIKEVRIKLVEQQQLLGKKGGVVMDGRDIGTVVFPNAELKLFLTASPDVRAERRFAEMTQKGMKVSMHDVEQNLRERDYIDSTRAESPLHQAEDAIVIDNSELNQSEQLELALSYVQNVLEQQIA